MSKFFVVGTPIGNMEDITLRAVRILGETDVVISEDTRVTQRLLNRYKIVKPIVSYPSDDFKPTPSNPRLEKIFSLIKEGKNVAFVTCAGTPAVSDPGSVLVARIRELFPAVEIIAIPGPTALATAISVSGLDTSEFVFLGFLPNKKGRETLFKEMAESKRTMIFYESPHRALKALASLQKFIPERKIVIARELTKIFEQVISGTSAEVLKYFTDNPDKVRGEFVVLVSGK